MVEFFVNGHFDKIGDPRTTVGLSFVKLFHVITPCPSKSIQRSLDKIVSPEAASQLDTISSENILKLNLTPSTPPSGDKNPTENCEDDRIHDIEARDHLTW